MINDQRKTEPPNLYTADLYNINQIWNEILKGLIRLLTHTDKQHIEPEGVNH